MKDSGARIVLGFFVTDRELETPQGRVRTQEREQSLPSLHVSPYLWIQPTLIENIWGKIVSILGMCRLSSLIFS
jgi:hypothetical protein